MRIAVLALVAMACHAPPSGMSVDLAAPDGRAAASIALRADGRRVIDIDTGPTPVLLEAAVRAPESVTTRLVPSHAIEQIGDGWFRPRPTPGGGELELVGDGWVEVEFRARGHVLEPVDPARAVVWHQPELLDDASVVSFASLMATIAGDDHGGRLLEAWFERFATTSYSERHKPAQLIAAIRQAQGDDPSRWDLRALPFRVTAVHNRFDLYATEGGCGELRVTVAATDEDLAPLHLIFLFEQPARDEDVAPDGTVHCLGTARAWSRLSALSEEEFFLAAGEWLDARLESDRFIMVESLERDDEVWEWRQWLPVPPSDPELAFALENPPLFQTVDIAAVNAPGPLRDDFLDFVADNADGLADRQVAIPARFRSPLAQMSQGEERPSLDLDGLDAAIVDRHPRLAEHIEIVGCVRCHTTPAAEFVQTYPHRHVSDFQFHEIEARAELLDRMNAGEVTAPPPFGPLQSY